MVLNLSPRGTILSYIYMCGSRSTKLLNTDPDPQPTVQKFDVLIHLFADYCPEAASVLCGGRFAVGPAGAGGRPSVGRPHLHP